MKKTRMEKGITLVALIITIVVLLILAVVAINAITDTDLIEKTNTAATTYNNSVTNEEGILNSYANKLNESLGTGATTTSSWEQNGETITKKNSDGTTTTLTVGDSVLLGEEGVPYSANGNSNWEVLGEQNGSLLLVSAESIIETQINSGANGSVDPVKSELDALCDDYLNTTYATEARSIREEDIKVGLDKISIGASYWLANGMVEEETGDDGVYIYCVHYTEGGEVFSQEWVGTCNGTIGHDARGVRAVVVLKPDVKVAKN